MLPYNLTRPACTAAASLLYLALVSTLIYAIAQTTRADLSMAARESKPGVSPAAALENPCVQLARIDRNICRIERKVELASDKLKQRKIARSAPVVASESSPSWNRRDESTSSSKRLAPEPVVERALALSN